MLETFYQILKDIEDYKQLDNGLFSSVNIKGKIIIFKYSKLINEVINLIESENENKNVLSYFKNDGLIGSKLISKLLMGGLKKYEVGYGNQDIDIAVNYINNECKLLKNKINNYNNGKIRNETPYEIEKRLEPYFSKEEIEKEVKTRTLNRGYIDFR